MTALQKMVHLALSIGGGEFFFWFLKRRMKAADVSLWECGKKKGDERATGALYNLQQGKDARSDAEFNGGVKSENGRRGEFRSEQRRNEKNRDEMEKKIRRMRMR